MSKIYTSADQLIGKTPLLELTHLEKEEGLEARVLGKLEYFNPSSIDFRNRYDFNKNRTFSNEIDATTPTILILKKPSIRFNLGYSFKYIAVR